MNELLVSFDREFEEVLETISTQSIIYILFLEKSLIEGIKNSN